MPEGDTLHRVAFTLRRALGGETLVRGRLVERSRGDGLGPLNLTDVDSPLARVRTFDGACVESIEARGKNLLIHLSTRQTICTHLGMEGAWHLYRVGERWRKAEEAARAVLETRERVAVCFRAPLVTLVETHRLHELPVLRNLGPDLLAERFDAAIGIARLHARPDAPVGVVIVDQRVVAGIGNVYKSETLFLERVSPFVMVSSLDDETIGAIFDRARRLMAANLTGYPRRTRRPPSGGNRAGEPRDGLWVYERSGRPCRRCGDRVAMERQGDLGRSTYYCPTCQNVPARSGVR